MSYKNAPISEAIIDMRVSEGTLPTQEALEAFASSYAEDFPVRHAIATVQVEVSPQNEQPQQIKSFNGVRLVRKDNARVLQVRRDGFTFSHLPPYTDWENFASEGLKIWRHYVEVFGITVVSRVAVRYINQIDIPEGVDITNYVGIYATFPDECGREIDGYFLQLTTRHPDVNPDCSVILNTGIVAASDPGKMGILLDIDAFIPGSFSPDSDVRGLLKSLREKKNKVFESLITDAVRELIQ